MSALKGISPLVAVVMLIAVTLFVAGILGGLVTQFAQTQGSIIKYCTGARFLLLGGVQKSVGGGLSDAIINVNNYGDVDLTLDVLQEYANGTVAKIPTSTVITAGGVGQLTLVSVNISDIQTFTIQSQECAGARNLISASELKSL